jgi:hypothetical protein
MTPDDSRTADIDVLSAGMPARELKLVSLSPDDLSPNPYNPNRQGESEFNELVTEVAHLGRCPKPIVVRRCVDRWEIVDGEHSWRAAREVGLLRVDCEVVEADTFEAMRQTYKRNQHGRHNPVQLGRMFSLMLAERGLSQRSLATTMCISESTVRNAMLYAEAADLRNSCAAAASEVHVDVSRLSVRQVRAYVRLPSPIGDTWLDSGADPKSLARATFVKHADEVEGKTVETDFSETEDGTSGWTLLVDAGLARRIEASSFVESSHEAFRLLLLRRELQPHIGDVDAYLRPIVEMHLPSGLVDRLPWCPDGDGYRVPIPPAEWASILCECSERAVSTAEMADLVGASIALALMRLGIRRSDPTDPRTRLALAVVNEAPLAIRQSSLSLADQYGLAKLMANWTGSVEALPEISQRACRVLEQVRRLGSTVGARTSTRLGGASTTPEVAFAYAVDAVSRERLLAERRRSLEDPSTLIAAVSDHIATAFATTKATEGQPAVDVLRDRLRALPFPELQLLGGLLLGVVESWDVWGRSILSQTLETSNLPDQAAVAPRVAAIPCPSEVHR